MSLQEKQEQTKREALEIRDQLATSSNEISRKLRSVLHTKADLLDALAVCQQQEIDELSQIGRK